MYKRAFIMGVVALAVAACQNEAPPQAPDSPAPAASEEKQVAMEQAPASPQWDESGTPVAGAELVLTPNPANFCAEETQAVEVRWNVEKVVPSRLQLWVEDPQGNRKLWTAASRYADAKMTGKWMREGSKVIAVDPVQNRVLNEVKLEAAPCDGEPLAAPAR